MTKFMRTINVEFSFEEYEKLLKKKGKATWHDYILNIGSDIEC